jgi:tetratricopeptide (TPR) repeat protein
LKEADLREREGRYADALRTLRRGERRLDGLPAATADAERARLMVSEAVVRLRQNRPADAIPLYERAISSAQRAGDRESEARALYLLDWAHFSRGGVTTAAHSGDALRLYEELGDVSGQASTLNNLGCYAYFEGRWDDAVELYERSRDARARTGAVVDAETGAYNIAEILCDQGHLDLADESLRAAIRVFRAAGDREGLALAMGLRGIVQARLGDVVAGERLLTDAREACALLGHDYEVAQTDLRLAECALLAGDPGRAAELAVAAKASGDPALVAAACRIEGLAQRDGGNPAAARTLLEESRAVALEAGEDFQLACTLRVLAPLLASDHDAALAAELSTRAAALLDAFGVVRLPAWADGAAIVMS